MTDPVVSAALQLLYSELFHTAVQSLRNDQLLIYVLCEVSI